MTNRLGNFLKTACTAMLVLSANVVGLLPAHAADTNTIGVRGCILDFVDDPWKVPGHADDAARYLPDGLLVISDGKVKECGDYSAISSKYPGLNITSYTNRIIMPGFVDGHIHVAQTRVLGAYGEQLLPWLLEWIFPEEIKFKNNDYAHEAINHYYDDLLSSGTTTVQDFGTGFESATEIYFDEAARRNMRVISGLSGMDERCPKELVTAPDDFYAACKRLIAKYHGHGRNLYAITPRFAYGDSPELMATMGKLHKEFPDCWVNTHVSENPTETKAAAEYHHTKDYLGCYEKYGLVGPKFTAGHGVWLSDSEFDRIAKAGASISFCPNSNTFLGSGLFRIGKATDPATRVRMTFGTDMGGGNSFSMINVLNQAYKIGMMNNEMLDGSIDPRWHNDAEAERNKLNAMRSYYSLTLGGARGLYLDDKLGNFNPGKEADFVVLDWNGGPPATAWHQSLICGDKAPQNIDQAAKLLFGTMAVGDERAVDETWVYGKRLYKKGEELNSGKAADMAYGKK